MATPQDLNVFIRGNVERKGPVVPRRFLEHPVAASEPAPFKEAAAQGTGGGDRQPDNPLTARVMVNRVWGMFFGQPIVPTPSNFGHSGQPPTNPQLLDDLAVRFMENGWSIKALVREIVLSATYRQRSDDDAAKAATDPANELLWRMNRRRLTHRAVARAVLSSPASWIGRRASRVELDDPKNLRRTVYARISRLKLNDMLDAVRLSGCERARGEAVGDHHADAEALHAEQPVHARSRRRRWRRGLTADAPRRDDGAYRSRPIDCSLRRAGRSGRDSWP